MRLSNLTPWPAQTPCATPVRFGAAGDGAGAPDLPPALLEKARSGDRQALSTVLYHNTQHKGIRWLIRVNIPPDQADDFLQETVANILSGYYTMGPGEDVNQFLRRAAQGTFRRQINDEKKHRQCFSIDFKPPDNFGMGTTLASSIEDSTNIPADKAEENETLALVEAALSRLDPKFAQAARMALLEGCTSNEIAERMNISPKKASIYKNRGIKRLRSALYWHGIQIATLQTGTSRKIRKKSPETDEFPVPQTLKSGLSEMIRQIKQDTAAPESTLLANWDETTLNRPLLKQLVGQLHAIDPALSPAQITTHLLEHAALLPGKEKTALLLTLAGTAPEPIATHLGISPHTLRIELINNAKTNLVQAPFLNLAEPASSPARIPNPDDAPYIILSPGIITSMAKQATDNPETYRRIQGITARQFSDYFEQRLPGVSPQMVFNLASRVTQRLEPRSLLALFLRTNSIPYPVIRHQLGFTSEHIIKTVVKKGQSLFAQSFAPLLSRHGVLPPPSQRVVLLNNLTADALLNDPHKGPPTRDLLKYLHAGAGASQSVEPFIRLHRDRFMAFLQQNVWSMGRDNTEEAQSQLNSLLENFIQAMGKVNLQGRSVYPTLLLLFMGLPIQEIPKVIDTTERHVAWTLQSSIVQLEQNLGISLGRPHAYEGTYFFLSQPDSLAPEKE